MPSPYSQSLLGSLGGQTYQPNFQAGQFGVPDNLGQMILQNARTQSVDTNSPQYQRDMGMRMAQPNMRGGMRGSAPQRYPHSGVFSMSPRQVVDMMPEFANRPTKFPRGSDEYNRRLQMQIDTDSHQRFLESLMGRRGGNPMQQPQQESSIRNMPFIYGVDDQGPGLQNMPFIYGVHDQDPNPIIPLYNRMTQPQQQNRYYGYGPVNGTP